METNNRKQLVTQDNGNIEKIFPKNYMSNIVDEETGESLRIFLLKYNHIDLGYRSSKSSARLAVPIIMRRKGLYITYYLPDDVVITEFFNGNKTEVSDTNWVKDELWVKDVNELNVYDVKISDGSITLDKLSEEVMQLISSKGDITINNFPDNEDLELYTIYQDSNNKIDAIRFKDRDNSNGMAYKYLRKTKNMILSQSDFNQANTIYEIRYDFDLNDNTISIPDNCELKFVGGSLKNGTINFNNTLLSGDIKIKTNVLGNIRNNEVNVLWFNVTGDGNTDDRNTIQEVIDIVSESTTILFPKVNNFYNVIIAKGNGNTIIEQRANAVYSGSLYPLIINKNNITIVIRGTIKSTNILGNMFEVSGNNVVIIGEDGKLQGIGGTDDEGFLDTNTSDTTLQWHPCLIKINGDNCRINNLSFEDYPTHGIDCYGKALIVDSCLFIGGRIEHSTTGGTVLMGIRTNTGADSVIMKNNRFIANLKGGKCYSCMFPSGDKFIISNNICEKYHEHAVYAYGNYGSIIDNKFTDVDCIASDIQYFAIYGIIKGNFSIGTEGFIQIMHGKGTIVEGNTVTNCRGGIIVRPYHTVDINKLPSGLKLLNNFIELTVGTTGSCLSFYVLGTYDISDILISGNTFANGYYTQASQVAASLLIGAGSSENNGIKFLRVENNVIRSGRGAVSWLKGIHNSIFKNNKFISESLDDVASAFSFAINANYVTDTIFEGNEFIDIKSTSTLARAIQLNTGTTNLSVIDNNIINYTSNIYLDYDTDAKLIYKRNNRRNYLPLAGTYDNKPNAYAQEYGVGYYDKDNQVPMWWSGVRWKDAEGCYIVLSKSDINTPNKIYKIRFNIDLGGTTLTLPANCTLDFQGGSFSNGTIVGSNTKIIAGLQKIFNSDIILTGTWNVEESYPEWFGAVGDGVTNDTVALTKCINYFIVTSLSARTYITDQIDNIPSFRTIRGCGKKSIIQANPSMELTNSYLLRTKDGGSGIIFSDFVLLGGSNSTEANYKIGGILLRSTSNDVNDQWDTRNVIQNVEIKNCYAASIYIGTYQRENKIVNCFISHTTNVGINCNGTDNMIIGCTVASSHQEGIIINGNNRIDSCKMFGCGASTTETGKYALKLIGNKCNVSNVELQQNNYGGCIIQGNSNYVQVTCDNNGSGTTTTVIGCSVVGSYNTVIVTSYNFSFHDDNYERYFVSTNWNTVGNNIIINGTPLANNKMATLSPWSIDNICNNILWNGFNLTQARETPFNKYLVPNKYTTNGTGAFIQNNCGLAFRIASATAINVDVLSYSFSIPNAIMIDNNGCFSVKARFHKDSDVNSIIYPVIRIITTYTNSSGSSVTRTDKNTVINLLDNKDSLDVYALTSYHYLDDKPVSINSIIVEFVVMSKAIASGLTINAYFDDIRIGGTTAGDKIAFLNEKGTTSARPTLALVSAGFKYYDTTLNKYIMSNGTAWTNLDGTALT